MTRSILGIAIAASCLALPVAAAGQGSPTYGRSYRYSVRKGPKAHYRELARQRPVAALRGDADDDRTRARTALVASGWDARVAERVADDAALSAALLADRPVTLYQGLYLHDGQVSDRGTEYFTPEPERALSYARIAASDLAGPGGAGSLVVVEVQIPSRYVVQTAYRDAEGRWKPGGFNEDGSPQRQVRVTFPRGKGLLTWAVDATPHPLPRQ